MALSYRLYGDLFLEDPSLYLESQQLDRLRVLEPHFRDLEKRRSPGML